MSLEPGQICKNKWISVTDKLPKPFERVLICSSSTVYIGSLITDWFATDEGYAKNIKYWMPLPEIPRDAE
jgi:uncharacterized protein DUF551